MKRYISIFKESHEEILKQLGGNKFIAMTGAKNLAYSNNGNTLSFKIGSGAKKSISYISITLNSNDNYDMQFMNRSLKVVSQYNDIGVEQLKPLFTKETGFDTSL